MGDQRQRIGFIGLGNMGGPMATRLAAAGYDVTAFDITADGPTADHAVAAVRRQLDERVRAGAVLVPVPLPVAVAVTRPGLPPMPSLADHPLFDDWLKAVEECRKEADAADAARGV